MENKSVKETGDEIIEEFGLFEDWMSKYEYIIELGKKLPVIDPEFKTEEYKVKGCQSQVWLNADYRDGKIFYRADSDAIITKGIISLLIRVLSGHNPEEVLNADMHFIDKTGLKEHLSPNRANGLTAMIKQMKNLAANYTGKNA
ncbi:MAG: SufE family protein [Ignavibacteria bacterium]|nr:SufE family protein [Ignavibacteria bacterium]